MAATWSLERLRKRDTRGTGVRTCGASARRSGWDRSMCFCFCGGWTQDGRDLGWYLEFSICPQSSHQLRTALPNKKYTMYSVAHSAQPRSIRGHEHSDSRRHALAERVEPLGKGSEGQDFGESL